MPKPILSIGIIFKDEIRCLERCLSSLTSLRQAVPCELVMADTGSGDGSREVAEKYADILIDFPWINDFAAARNAVMDRCTGRWYFSLDADEWLDGDIQELTAFLRSNNRKAGECCTVRIRNYFNAGADADYSDFMGVRLLRMSTGLRFQGAIHETWKYGGGRVLQANPLSKTILHHDGYVGLNSAQGEAKRKRNLEILQREVAEDPQSVRLLVQCVESSGLDAGRMDYIRRAVAATEAKGTDWENFGPVAFRYAVAEARDRGLPEMEEWVQKAESLFPNSFYTRMDVAYYAFLSCWDGSDYAGAVRRGEGYLAAMADYQAGRGDQEALMISTLHFATPKWEQALRIVLAHAYLRDARPERTLEQLEKVDFQAMDGEQTRNCVEVLRELHTTTPLDAGELVKRLYAGMRAPDAGRAEERKRIFLKEASEWFSMGYLKKERRQPGFLRRACELLAPLAGQCEWGDAAAVMAAKTAAEKEAALKALEKPYQLPREVLRQALEAGVVFPLAGRPLSLEEMDALADRLARRDGLAILRQAASRLDGGVQQLAWARGVAIAIVAAWEWEDEEQSLALARDFARVEGTFVSRCYAPEMLREENIGILPPMHRFGWYCGRAFDALEAGDAAGYVRRLRGGLDVCPAMKRMVEFLIEHTPELQPPKPSREMLELAEKVGFILDMYPADHPAVAALKASEAYRKAAHLIEGAHVPVFKGLPQ